MKTNIKFKKTPVGEIPEDWEVVELGNIVRFQRGYSYRRTDLSPLPTKVRFITINEFEKEGGLKKDVSPIFLKESLKIDEKFFLVPNDLLIANTDMTKGFIIGAPLLITPELIPKNGKAVFSMDLTKLIIIDNRVLPEFLFYWLMWEKIRKVMKQFAQGLNVKHLNHKLAKTLIVALPSLPEQRKIAEILRTVDEAIEKTDLAIERTERLKRGLMRELLTKGIGHKEFKKTEIGRVPKEWKVVRLGEILSEPISNGYSPRSPDYPTGKWILMLSALSEDGLREDQVKPAPLDDPKVDKFVLKEGDILISRANTRKLVGMAAMYKGKPPNCIYPDLMMLIRPDTDVVNGIFLEHWLRHPYSRSYFSTHARGTSESMVKINQEIVKKLPVPLPPLSEQQKIAEILSTVDRRLELLRERREKLERVKRGLMKDLLTGRRRVKLTG